MAASFTLGGRGQTHTLPPLSGITEHPDLGRLPYLIEEVPDDPDQQVAQVIGKMRKQSRLGAQSPIVQEDVYRAWQSDDALADTFEYLKRDGGRGMRFVRDEITALPFSRFENAPGGWRPFVEAIVTPEHLASCANPQGDCDCFCTYGAAHLKVRDVPCSYATVAADDIDPYMFSHVYLVAYPKSGPYAGMRVPMDLSHGPELGWEVPNRFGRLVEWPVDGGFLSDVLPIALLGIGGYLLYRSVAA